MQHGFFSAAMCGVSPTICRPQAVMCGVPATICGPQVVMCEPNSTHNEALHLTLIFRDNPHKNKAILYGGLRGGAI